MTLLTVDPSLRNTGLVLIASRGMLPINHWTVRCNGSFSDLSFAVDQWIETNLDSPVPVAVELPPPRIHGKTYQLEPAVAAGVWIHALEAAECRTYPIPAGEWMSSQLGLSRTWPGGKSKRMAKLVCEGLGVSLPNEHTRDAYLCGRHFLKRNRWSRIMGKTAPGKRYVESP